MPVDPNVILSRLATSWSLLTQSVNQVLQAARGDPHHIHLQSNNLAQFENVFKLHRNILDDHSRTNLEVSIDRIRHLLREAALLSSNPPTWPPALVQAQFKCSGRGGRPQADISPQLLRSLTQSYGGVAKIATLLGFHPRMIRRYQLRWGLVSAGLAPRQLDFIDKSGRPHYRHHSSLPTMSSLTDEQLDHVMAEILRDYLNHGRSLIDGAIVSRGLHVSRDRIDASRLRVHGPPPPFR
ncbi:hypothetical protein ARMGADRAFT_1088908 [Armillaria gallica]|uniref:Uncharacterized protein n=1 Tax=Armillaria gallica TaxID=47427 RepID=A0A2H3CLI5_ARMGA|nr:hypothetical protein ARMGADRAFT_1088908 [Armillaria gallica]